MQTVNHSEILPYSQADLFDLVSDIEAYPQFLPWCGSVTIHSRQKTVIEASVEVKKGFISKSFTTQNNLKRPHKMDMHLIEGPFKHLYGHWLFDKIKAGKTPETKVSLALEFEFDSAILATLLGPIFDHVSDTMLHHFCGRAQAMLGNKKALSHG